jgi:hypothetical protein
MAGLCAQLHAKFRVLLAEPRLVDGRGQDARELRKLERLDQEVDRPLFDRLDGLGHAAEAGHHDREYLGVPREGGVQDVHPVRVRQLQVHDDGIVGERLQALDGLGAGGRLRDGEARLGQRRRHGFAELGFVLDDEDAGLCSGRHGFPRE